MKIQPSVRDVISKQCNLVKIQQSVRRDISKQCKQIQHKEDFMNEMVIRHNWETSTHWTSIALFTLPLAADIDRRRRFTGGRSQSGGFAPSPLASTDMLNDASKSLSSFSPPWKKHFTYVLFNMHLVYFYYAYTIMDIYQNKQGLKKTLPIWFYISSH